MGQTIYGTYHDMNQGDLPVSKWDDFASVQLVPRMFGHYSFLRNGKLTAQLQEMGDLWGFAWSCGINFSGVHFRGVPFDFCLVTRVHVPQVRAR